MGLLVLLVSLRVFLVCICVVFSYEQHAWCTHAGGSLRVLCASRWLFSSFVCSEMTDGQVVDCLSSPIKDLRLSNTILHFLSLSAISLLSSLSPFVSLTLIHSLVLHLCSLPFFFDLHLLLFFILSCLAILLPLLSDLLSPCLTIVSNLSALYSSFYIVMCFSLTFLLALFFFSLEKYLNTVWRTPSHTHPQTSYMCTKTVCPACN